MTVPVIDLSGPTPAVARAIDEALRDVGFMAVTGHAVDDATLDAVFAAAARFFDLPAERKLAATTPVPGAPRGYRSVGGEAQAKANGAETPPDLSETFGAGQEPPPPGGDPASFPPNTWPEDVPELRAACLDHLVAMRRLADRVVRLLAVALGLEPGFFDPFVDRTMASMRINHYPALDGPPAAAQLRGGAHTDYGTFTFLATDGVPGLEILDEGGAWRPVDRVDGALHVNTGDLLAHWTGGRWRSTWHRVAVPAGRVERRLSVVYFHNPNDDALITPIGGAAAEPVRAGAFLREKLERLYDVPAPS